LLAGKDGGSRKQDHSNGYGDSFHLRLRDSMAEFPATHSWAKASENVFL
jgi:hypothetical protein